MNAPPLPAPGVPPSGPTPSKICPICGEKFASEIRFCPTDGVALRNTETGDTLIGEIVAGRFHILRQLGQGGMGTVYLAEQLRINRPCALKVIKGGNQLDPEAILRFNREAANASRITHANVAAVYDFGDAEGGLFYLAMEFVEGESLAQLIARDGWLAPRRAVSIAWQIADALGAAHELKMVHRDLKPENIMLAKHKDGSDFVKVVDFGIARVMDADSQKVTSTGHVIGTPRYMSPEQLTDRPIDARSDIFSLGLLTYHMLAGSLPWAATAPQEVLMVRLSHPMRRLGELRPETAWPESLERVLDRVLSTSPDDRPQTAVDFAIELAESVLSWLPDDPRATEPWNTRLRFATPRGSLRTSGPGSGPSSSSSAERLPDPSATAMFGSSGTAPLQRPMSTGAETATTEVRRTWRTPAVMVTLVSLLVTTAAGGVFTWQRFGRAQVPPVRVDTTRQPKTASGADSVPAGSVGSDPATRGKPDTSSVKPAGNSGVGVDGKGASQRAANGSKERQKESSDPQAGRTTADSHLPPKETLPARPLTAEQARTLLDRLRDLTAPGGGNASANARDALDLAERALPNLPTRSDSVEAQFYMVNGHLALDEPRLACQILLRIAPDARGTRFGVAVGAMLADKDLACR